MLAWNLGHHDFAPRHLAGKYMGVHVTLTGVRGMYAPILAVVIYELLEGLRPGLGPWVLALSLLLTLSGTVGFHVMARKMGSRRMAARRTD